MRTIAAVAAALVAGVSFAAAPTSLPATSACTQAVASEKLQRELNRHLPKLDVTAAPISDVLDFIRDRGVTLYVNWRSLERFSIDRSTPVTLSLKDASHASVLDAVLEKADPGGKRNVWWCADENVVVIAARSDLPHYGEIKERLDLRRWDDATQVALASRVAKLRLDAERLRFAASTIGEQTKLDIALDREGLNRSGIDLDDQISIHVANVSGREVAALLLFELDAKGRVAMSPRGGKCVITPREPFRVDRWD